MRVGWINERSVKETHEVIMTLYGAKGVSYSGPVTIVVNKDNSKIKYKYSLDTISVGEFTNDNGDVLADELINRNQLYSELEYNLEK